MPCRVFRDPAGEEWTAWDVVPGGLLERRVAERRAQLLTRFGAPERRLADRRLRDGRRTSLRGALALGWLCFESPAERRRLSPIPDNWNRASDARLVEYCRQATPVPRAHLRLDAAATPQPNDIRRRDIA
jgi:hypothetical protein